MSDNAIMGENFDKQYFYFLYSYTANKEGNLISEWVTNNTLLTNQISYFLDVNLLVKLGYTGEYL